MDETVDIYQYEDYRVYIGDMLEREKNLPGFSYRNFAMKADLTNPGYINDVVKGRRRLSKVALQKIAKIFKLSPRESEYLGLLARFAHANQTAEKDEVYSEMVRRRSHTTFARINPSLAKYYQDFRYPLIRAAIMILNFTGDFEQISSFLTTPIPAHTVKKLTADLIDWNLVKIDESGRYVVTETFVAPSPKLNRQVREINRQWMKIAEEALLNLSSDERHVSSMVVNVSKETRDIIYSKIENFRKDIWELVSKDENASECIMLLNNQFVPLSNERNDS